MLSLILLLAPQQLAPPPIEPLRLPPPPPMPVQRIESDPPYERIGARLRFEPFAPWVLAQVSLGARTSAPTRATLGLDLRLVLPVRIYGEGAELGPAIAPTGSLVTQGAFPDHATGGLAVGYLINDRHNRLGRSAYRAGGILVAVEAAQPFSRAGGAHLGLATSLRLLVTPLSMSLGLGYTYLPLASGSSRALLLSVGLNLMELVRS